MRPYRGLRHVVWFEFLGSHEDGSELRRIVEPGFFLIRLVDHYMLAGVEMVQLESISATSIRRLLDAMPESHAHRKLILSALNTLQQCLNDDIRPALPALRAYAKALGKEPWGKALARDMSATLREYSG